MWVGQQRKTSEANVSEERVEKRIKSNQLLVLIDACFFGETGKKKA